MANGAAFQKKWWLLCAHKLVLINGDLLSGTHFTAALLFTLLLLYCLATSSGLELAIEDAVDMKDVRDVREVRHVAAAGRYSICCCFTAALLLLYCERRETRRRGWQVLNLLALRVE
jgi:hypothetical protein